MSGLPTPVVVVSPYAKPGGAERALAGLVRRLPEAGFRPVVVLLEPGPAQTWLEQAGCETTLATGDHGSKVAHVRAVAERIGAPVLVSSKREGHAVGAVAAAEIRIPAVWWQQDLPRGLPRELETAALPTAATACCSDHVLSAQRRLAPGVPAVRIHLGVPVDEIAARRGSGEAIRARLVPDGGPLAGIVGRLDRWKGQDAFLRAAATVAERRPDARFAVVGGAVLGHEGTYPDEVRALAAELGLGDRVCFAGHQDDPYPWIDALDVAVVASVGEPFGLVAVEAMALGTPVVAVASGGPEEIVRPGRSGLLVPPGDDRALADATLRVLEDPELARRLGAGGRRRASRFDERRTAAAFAALLRDVVAGRIG